MKVSYCVLMKSSDSSGDITSMIDPRASIWLTKFSSAAAAFIHSPQVAAMSSGRSLGPAMPVQPIICSSSGWPSSAAVGASKPTTGSAVVTRSGVICPLETKPARAEVLVQRKSAVPLSTAVAASPPPPCGMCVAALAASSSPKASSTMAPARCRPEPTPDDE